MPTGRWWTFWCLLFAVVAFTAAYLTYDVDRALDGAPTASGVIVDVVDPVKGGQYVEVDVELPDGRTVRMSISDFLDTTTPRKGGQIRVQYRPDGSGWLAREAGVGPDRTSEIGWTLAVRAAGAGYGMSWPPLTSISWPVT